MDATTNNTLAAQTNTANLPSASSGNQAALSSDFETFLKMLTAQARYQDPLEPIDSTEYAAQLAQFSMVEQQVQSNELLTLLADKIGGDTMASMANWIGKEARTDSPVYFDGSPITIFPNVPAGTDQMYLVVKDASGAEVQRQALAVSSDSIEWSGAQDNGTAFENGTYSISIEAYGNNEHISTSPVEHYSRITEIRNEAGSVQLVLNGGQIIPTGAITALREVS